MELQLLNFIAVLQLLAGLCLLFFYDDILKKVVATDARRMCIVHLNDIRNHIQIQLEDFNMQRLYSLIDCESYGDGKYDELKYFRRSVNYCGKLAFVFLFVLMIVASHESPDNRHKLCYSWMVVADIIFIISCFLAFRYRTKQCFSGYWSFILPSIAIIAVSILTFIPSLQFGLLGNRISIYLLLLTFLLVSLLIVLVFLYDEWRSSMLSLRLKELKEAVEIFGNWSLNPNNYGNYFLLRQKVGVLFSFNENQPDAQTKFDIYVNDRLQVIINSHKTTSIILKKPFYKIKDIVSGMLSNMVLAVVNLLLILIVLLFIIEWYQLFNQSEFII